MTAYGSHSNRRLLWMISAVNPPAPVHGCSSSEFDLFMGRSEPDDAVTTVSLVDAHTAVRRCDIVMRCFWVLSPTTTPTLGNWMSIDRLARPSLQCQVNELLHASYPSGVRKLSSSSSTQSETVGLIFQKSIRCHGSQYTVWRSQQRPRLFANRPRSSSGCGARQGGSAANGFYCGSHKLTKLDYRQALC